MVSVEIVASKAHGKKYQHPLIFERVKEVPRFDARRTGFLELHKRTVETYDPMGREDKQRGRSTNEHDDKESEIGSC